MIGSGKSLLHYRLLDKIGEGGMGVVWRAMDTTLNREVAIKILPEAFASSPDRLSRFEREAQVLASLNHPGIAAIYGLHQADGLRFIAMELVPGEDLSERLARGPLSVEDSIHVARQVAEALEAAHEKGIIHRDLKPANIKRTPDGQIKVLDLGLAKALAPESQASAASHSLSPTATSAGTVAGTLLGTAAYMSPEQVKGREADRRSDIWSFGCVLREMLTGERTFEGESISEVMASVLRDEPDSESLPAETPAVVRRLLRRCLDRDPQTRLRDIGEARIALSPENFDRAEPPPVAPASSGPSPSPRAAGRAGWWLAALALVAVTVVSVTALRREAPRAAAPEIRARIAPPEEHRFEVNGKYAGALSLSPDGTKMTFAAVTGSGRPSLWLRTLGSEAPQPIPGTEGASYPFWSPDSRQLAFFAEGKLKKIDLEVGAPMTLAPAPNGRGGSWNEQGLILYAPDTQAVIHRVTAGGVEGDPVTTIDPSRGGESTHRSPFFLPDGRHFLYFRGSHAAAGGDEVNSIWIGDLDSGETRELLSSETNAVYAQGHLFWVREQFLMARPFSPQRLEFEGEAFAVGEGLVVQPSYWRGAFAVSEAGPIAFQSGLASDLFLKWFDRNGEELAHIADADRYEAVRLSPDDRTLAVTLASDSTGSHDIWLVDLERGVSSRLTFDDANDSKPVWSPDGKSIAFESNRGGGSGNIYTRRTDGRGEAELLFESEGQDSPMDWSRDGKYLSLDHGIGRYDLWLLPLEGGEPIVLVETEYDEGYSRFSPDSRWIAYVSNETGRYELYLTRVPGGEGKWQLSKEGADWVLGWNEGGTEIYYLDLEAVLCSVKVELGDQVVADLPEQLFPTRVTAAWDSTGDGQRFVLGVPDDSGEDFPITLIVNWDHGPGPS